LFTNPKSTSNVNYTTTLGYTGKRRPTSSFPGKTKLHA